jgi:hypothetical protein
MVTSNNRLEFARFSLFGGVCMLLSAVLALLASHLVGLKKHNKPLQSIARKNARSG